MLLKKFLGVMCVSVMIFPKKKVMDLGHGMCKCIVDTWVVVKMMKDEFLKASVKVSAKIIWNYGS